MSGENSQSEIDMTLSTVRAIVRLRQPRPHVGADGPGVIFTAGFGVIVTAGLGAIYCWPWCDFYCWPWCDFYYWPWN